MIGENTILYKSAILVVAATVIALVGFFNHDVYALNSTSTTVTPNPSTVNSWAQVTFTATVADTSSLPTTPTGNVTWSDSNAHGVFNPAYCTLPSGGCTTSYTPATNSSTVTITASYTGDSAHSTSSGTSSLVVNHVRSTTTTVTPNSAIVNSGSQVTFTATVADTSSLPTTPTGNVTWSDSNAHGVFNPAYCTLPSGGCTTSYTPATNSPATVTITASYTGDSSHLASAGVSTLSVNLLHHTTATITPNPATLSSNGTVILVVQVTDSSSTPTTAIGVVSLIDNNAGGRFNVTSCTLSSGGTCAMLYTASSNPPNVITINATYSGDNTHLSSFVVTKISTNVVKTTTTTVTTNPSTANSGTQVTVTVNVADISNPSAALIGIVSWSDNGAGGTFNQNACILSGNHCSLEYTPPSNVPNTITITANYVGDSSHSGSFGSSSLSVTIPTNIQPSTQSTPPTQTPTYQIPNWIKNNAKWWHDNSISDDEFEKGIQYLIQQKIMKIPETQSGNGTTKQVPSWVKNNAGWWADGQITDDEFVKAIQYLIQIGSIKV